MQERTRTAELISLCGFCSNLEYKIGGSTPEFAQFYPEMTQKGQVLDASGNLVLLADTSPISEDHLMLITKDHYPSFAAIPAELREESEQKLGEVLEKMAQFHPDKELFVFEHGVGEIDGEVVQCGGCINTDHAHLHIIPLAKVDEHNASMLLSERIPEELELEQHEIKSLPNLNFSITRDFPYLYLGTYETNSTGQLFVQGSTNTKIPSQLVRKLVAVTYFGKDENDPTEWDWRDSVLLHPHEAKTMMEYTLQRWLSTQTR